MSPRRFLSFPRTSLLLTTAAIAFHLIAAVAPAHAFDGSRQGFVLGAGAGLGAVSFTQKLSAGGFSLESDRENKAALFTDFHIGWGLDERTVLTYAARVGWFGLEVITGDAGGEPTTGDVTITNGVGVLSLTKYGASTTPTTYFRAGVGFSSWDAPFESDAGDPATGLGLLAGVGYEYRAHWSIEVGVTWGLPTVDVGSTELETNAFSVYAVLIGSAY